MPQWSINMTQDLFEKEFQNIKDSFFQYSFLEMKAFIFYF